MKKIITIAFLIIIFFSCSESRDSNKKIYIDTSTIKPGRPDEFFDNIEINPLSTKETSLISHVRKIIYQDMELYVFDQYQGEILVFDIKGEFRRKLKKIGKGPGEYLGIVDFTINPYNNNIELLDGYNLYIYSNDCNFIEKIKLRNAELKAVNELEIIDDDKIVFSQGGTHSLYVIYSMKNRKIIKSQEIYPIWLEKKMMFNTIHSLYRNGPIINYLEGWSNKVYSINADGFRLKYEWDFGKYNFDFEESSLSNLIKNSTVNELTRNHNVFLDKYILQFNHNLENDKFILTSFLFKGNPASLLYNKKTGKYILFNDKLSFLLFTSTVEFISEDKLIVIVEPKNLKELPMDWFPSDSQKLIKDINILNNPVVLNLTLKKDLLQ